MGGGGRWGGGKWEWGWGGGGWGGGVGGSHFENHCSEGHSYRLRAFPRICLVAHPPLPSPWVLHLICCFTPGIWVNSGGGRSQRMQPCRFIPDGPHTANQETTSLCSPELPLCSPSCSSRTLAWITVWTWERTTTGESPSSPVMHGLGGNQVHSPTADWPVSRGHLLSAHTPFLHTESPFMRTRAGEIQSEEEMQSCPQEAPSLRGSA